jgi:hypothetical protein
VRFVAIALLLAACMPASYHKAKRLEGRYALGAPGAGWSSVQPGAADHAWYNADLHATIYADSNCGPRYTDSLPQDLATELAAGIVGIQTQKDEPLPLDGREGVLRVQSGKLDGVPITVALGVLNKGLCTYDFTYIAPPDRFDAGWGAYRAVLDGFRTK